MCQGSGCGCGIFGNQIDLKDNPTDPTMLQVVKDWLIAEFQLACYPNGKCVDLAMRGGVL